MKIFAVFCGFVLSLIISAIFLYFSKAWIPHGNGGVSKEFAYTMLVLTILSPVVGIIWSIWKLKKNT